MKDMIRWFLLFILSFMLIGGKWALAGDMGTMLKAMADPAGAPFYPVSMQVLQVLTWMLHMIFVYTSVGGLFFSYIRFYKKRREVAKAC
jgi:hypothetical protein